MTCYKNETVYPTREVGKIVRWVLRYLDAEKLGGYVKVKHKNGFGPYSGMFYGHAHSQGGHIWDNEWQMWKEVRPTLPREYKHLIVCRIQKPGSYPNETHVYDRKDSPGSWVVEDWQEALVSILAHEAMHLRQMCLKKKGTPGRFNEVETEWAAYRLCMEWRKEHQGAL